MECGFDAGTPLRSTAVYSALLLFVIFEGELILTVVSLSNLELDFTLIVALLAYSAVEILLTGK